MLRHYRDDYRVLSAAAPAFSWPDAMRSKSERSEKAASLSLLRQAAARLSVEGIGMLTKFAETMR